MKYITLNKEGAILSLSSEKGQASFAIQDEVARTIKAPENNGLRSRTNLPEVYYIREGETVIKKTRKPSKQLEGTDTEISLPKFGYEGYEEKEVLDSLVISKAIEIGAEKCGYEVMGEGEKEIQKHLSKDMAILEGLRKAKSLKEVYKLA